MSRSDLSHIDLSCIDSIDILVFDCFLTATLHMRVYAHMYALCT